MARGAYHKASPPRPTDGREGQRGPNSFGAPCPSIGPRTPGTLRLDTPAGLVVAEYRQEGDHVEEVRITEEDEYFPLPPELRRMLAVLGDLVTGGFGGRAASITEDDRAFTATEALAAITD